MKTAFIALLFCSLLVGCQTFQPYSDVNETDFSIPPLNTETTVSLGESMLAQGHYETGLAVRVISDIGVMPVFVPKGTYFANGVRPTFDQNGKQVGNVYRFTENLNFYGRPIWIEYNNAKEEFRLKTSGGSKVITECELVPSAKKITDKSFQQTLIYLGKTGNTLKFGYRESYQDFARPAFSNEITYDLNDSNIIGYKKAKLQVISATNSEITYKVLSYFDDSNDFASLD